LNQFAAARILPLCCPMLSTEVELPSFPTLSNDVLIGDSRMAKNILVGVLMLASALSASNAAFADEPSLHQIYQAAEAGKLNEAQTMMQEVLKAHPKSGKAHFVEAELLARQGQLQNAKAELATAELLAPGLPFAKPDAVKNLKGLVGASSNLQPAKVQHIQVAQPAHDSSFPWGTLFIGLGLAAFIAFAVRFMSQRSAIPTATGNPSGGFGPVNSASPIGSPMQPYGAGGVGSVGAAPGVGLGSRVMGGLATGAAVGAGVVAGEALMHRFMDGHRAESNSDQRFSSFDSIPNMPSTPLDSMGGNDFGISDSSSWDDVGDSGDSEWN
jgi:uncharacterized protein